MNQNAPSNAVPPALICNPAESCLNPCSCTSLMNLQSQILTAVKKVALLLPYRSTPSGMLVDKLVSADISGFTPLHYIVASDNDYELAQELVFIFRQIGQFQFLTIMDNQGRTPLHWAVMSGSVRMVKLLIENEVPLNIQDYDGNTPIHSAIAAINKFQDTEKLEACREIFRYLVSRADLNQKDLEGLSALHLASELGDLESIRLLIENGAWINIQDHQGENALFYAVRGEHIEVIKALVEEYNIDIEMLNEDDENILDLCKSIGNNSILEMMTSLYNARVSQKMDCLLKETNGIKWSGQKVELLTSNSGSIRFSGHSCA